MFGALTALFTVALLAASICMAQSNVDQQRIACVHAGGHDVKVGLFDYRCDGLPTRTGR